MKKWLLFILLIFLANFGFASANTALVLVIDTAISPATQDYIHKGLEEAEREQASAVILQLDTPGGLDTAMRGIIHDILISPVPVITYVAPSGARAASAGTYILYASAIAAMAPGTNVGAATPVSAGLGTSSIEQRKTKNDALAYLRSLAELHGRNIPWTQKAVLQSASLSAEEALKLRVIDLIAPDIFTLFRAVNGKSVIVQGQQQALDTLGLKIRTLQPDWRTQFLSVITNPNIAYLLLLLGFCGLFFELLNPGLVLPGVTGAIALLIALYAFQLLPINYAGLALIILGVMFFLGEIYFPSGALALGGIVALIFGSILLLGKGVPGFGVAWSVIFTVGAVAIIFFLGVGSLALRARRRPIVSGQEELVGSVGTIAQVSEQGAWMRLRGELWQVRSHERLRVGDTVQVTSREGLILWVKPTGVLI